MHPKAPPDSETNPLDLWTLLKGHGDRTGEESTQSHTLIRLSRCLPTLLTLPRLSLMGRGDIDIQNIIQRVVEVEVEVEGVSTTTRPLPLEDTATRRRRGGIRRTSTLPTSLQDAGIVVTIMTIMADDRIRQIMGTVAGTIMAIIIMGRLYIMPPVREDDMETGGIIRQVMRGIMEEM